MLLWGKIVPYVRLRHRPTIGYGSITSGWCRPLRLIRLHGCNISLYLKESKTPPLPKKARVQTLTFVFPMEADMASATYATINFSLP